MDFVLDDRISEDSVRIGRLDLCEVRLHRDARYPWVLLVPRRAQIREIHELSQDEQTMLIQESSSVSRAMQHLLEADKMNVAALGNMVPQLHVHHIARFENDDAWPGAIWGAHPALEYSRADLAARISTLQDAFARIETFVPEPQTES